MRNLQIFLGISWYVLAVGGIMAAIRFPVLPTHYLTYWLDAILVISVAMVLIHFLKLYEK